MSYEEIRVEHLNLETGSAALHGDMPVSITFDAHRGAPSEDISVNAKFDVSADSTAQQIRLAAVNLSGTLNRPGEDRPIVWELSAPALAANLAEASAAGGGIRTQLRRGATLGERDGRRTCLKK